MKRKRRTIWADTPWTFRQSVLNNVRRHVCALMGVAFFALLFCWYLAAPREWLKYLLLAALGTVWLAAVSDTLRNGVGSDNIFGRVRRDEEPHKFWMMFAVHTAIGCAVFVTGMALLARHWWLS